MHDVLAMLRGAKAISGDFGDVTRLVDQAITKLESINDAFDPYI